jgi:hypothetical protein
MLYDQLTYKAQSNKAGKRPQHSNHAIRDRGLVRREQYPQCAMRANRYPEANQDRNTKESEIS